MPAFYSLAGSKCGKCSKLSFPSAMICRDCGSTAADDFYFSGNGKLVTYTVIRQQLNDSNEKSSLIAANPCIIGIVQLDEGPMITSQIADSEPDAMETGKPVKAVFRRISEEGEEGLIRYGYKFVFA